MDKQENTPAAYKRHGHDNSCHGRQRKELAEHTVGQLHGMLRQVTAAVVMYTFCVRYPYRFMDVKR